MSLGLASALAARHPLWPAQVLGLVLAWTILTVRFPGLWLRVVPALLPLLDFAPWTGWQVVDEFDLLLLATLAGGHLRAAAEAEMPDRPSGSWMFRTLTWLVGASCVLALLRGWLDAGGGGFDPFQDVEGPANSIRVAKSLLFAMLLAPILRRELEASFDAALRRLCSGMWAGMAIVVVAVLWERTAYPGLLDFSSPYRTTALFWEMHVGGAAIDVYVAIAAPFAAWAVWSARTATGSLAAAVLALAWGYVGLTTFSRGVYLGVGVSLALLGWLVWRGGRSRPARHGRLGDSLLVVGLLVEALLVGGSGSFMGSRLAASDHDLSSRMSHWRHGLQLLRTPANVLIGLGAGRLPAHYAAEVPRSEFSGSARVERGPTGARRSVVVLSGPKTVRALGGLYGLTQRVPLIAGARYGIELAARARTDTDLRLLVCEVHLLYSRHCQSASLWLPAAAASDPPTWVDLGLPLGGPSLDPGSAFAPRLGLLALEVGNAGGVVELTDIRLGTPGHPRLIANGRFDAGLAHWFSLAHRYFLPWHIDNLVLETLIERGAVGLLLFAGWMALALSAVLRGPGARHPFSPFMAASLAGVLAVGLVSSVMDMPRVAFLFVWLALWASHFGVETSSTTPA